MIDWELQNVPSAAELLLDPFFDDLRVMGLVQGTPMSAVPGQPTLQSSALRALSSLQDEGLALNAAALLAMLHPEQQHQRQ
jgi:hypothetical protein